LIKYIKKLIITAAIMLPAAPASAAGAYHYQCAGGDGFALTAVFVPAKKPYARITYQGRGLSLNQVPAGSGAKFRSQQDSDYHAVVFWTRGDRAMFEQDGKTMQCEMMATQVNQ